MRVEAATLADLPSIHAAYEAGRAKQRTQRSSVWPAFTDAAIIREIDAGCLFCVKDDASLVGVFTMVEEDALIWGDDERGEHLYLHRIARDTSYPGRGLVDAMLDWAFQQCNARGRASLRMDTWASNDVLIAFYGARGFELVGTRVMPMDERLSPHYRGTELALLESRCRTRNG